MCLFLCVGGRGEGAVRTHRPQVAPVTLQEPLQEPKWREEEEEGGGSRRKEEEEGGGGREEEEGGGGGGSMHPGGKFLKGFF